MRRPFVMWAVFALCAALPCAFGQSPDNSADKSAGPTLTPTPEQLRQQAKVHNVPEIPYEPVAGLFKMPPGLYMGEAMGVATNSKGHVFVFTRSAATRLFEFDQNGRYVREMGRGLYGFVFAHSVRVDAHDNVWVVDEGSNMAIEFDPRGRVAMVIGRRAAAIDGVPEMGPGGLTPANPVPQPYVLDRPTDIGWDAAGNIFIADGYGNSRVVKYDPDGHFVAQTAGPGTGPGQMHLPHSLQVDRAGNVYVADRSNYRIQVLDNDLKYKTEYTSVGQPWTLCISSGPHQYLYSSNSYPDQNNSVVKPFSGEIYKMELDGTVLGRFGKPGKQPGEFSTTHGIDCRNDGQLYISEITSWRVQKILLGKVRP
ncbi:MAG TPA: peptidyl-alpha-hydroxyglycine alpha-amidating lyase family protein [Steroidobacteraceae bacterium]